MKVTSLVRIGLVCLCVLTSGCFSDHSAGYDQAVRDVREARKRGDLAEEGGMQLLDAFQMAPVDPQKSADWNAGYRQGFREEVRK